MFTCVLGRYAASTVLLQELCESRGGHPGLSVSNSPYGLCGRKVTLNLNGEYPSLSEGADSIGGQLA